MNPNNPKNTKVLMLLTNAFDPDPRVHQEAMALVSAGYDVTILCWDRDLKAPAFEMIDGIKIERIYVKSTHGRGTSQLLFLLLFWLKAYARSIKKQYDIVHCHDFDTLPLGFVLAKQKRVKLVYDAHESYVDMLVNIPSWLRRTIYKFENVFLKRIHLLITVGVILKETLERRGARKTCVVGNWKDPEKYQFPESLIEGEKNRLKISNNQLIISFIADLGNERQLPQLIKAISYMPEVFLILGGDGPAKGLAESAAEKYSNIYFLGYVHPSKVPFYTALADVIFYGFDPDNPNSKFSAPNKLFEAIAAGKAILTGDFGEIGRIVKEWKCGITLKNYTKLEITRSINMFNSKKWMKIFRTNALKAANNIYNWQNAEKILIWNYNLL